MLRGLITSPSGTLAPFSAARPFAFETLLARGRSDTTLRASSVIRKRADSLDCLWLEHDTQQTESRNVGHIHPMGFDISD